MATRNALLACRGLPSRAVTASRFSCAVPLVRASARWVQTQATASDSAAPSSSTSTSAQPASSISFADITASYASSSKIVDGVVEPVVEASTTVAVEPTLEANETTTDAVNPAVETNVEANETTGDAQGVGADDTDPDRARFRDAVDVWRRAGLPRDVARKLANHFPEIQRPTPAQRAFLLSLGRGDVDIYYKDYMGQGKTFSLVLGALTVVNKSSKQVVLFVPTRHLVQQVGALFDILGPEHKVHASVLDPLKMDWNAQVVITTPTIFNDAPPKPKSLPNLSHIFLDEPDTMLGPLPARGTDERRLVRHPINLHPPHIVKALNKLLRIFEEQDGPRYLGKTKKGILNFNSRLPIRTVWASATLNSELRRLTFGRGWVRAGNEKQNKSSGIIDLDFTHTASQRQLDVRAGFEEMGQITDIPAHRAPRITKPRNHVFVVDRAGDVHPLDMSEPAYGQSGQQTKGEVAATVMEALALLHTTSPPPPGTFALALMPNQGSIKNIDSELGSLGVFTIPLVPEIMAEGIEPPSGDEPTPLLLAQRSAVPGLHLKNLHTVYLLNGLDMATLSPHQREYKGKQLRQTFYDIVTGRLGRMGALNPVPGRPQRVISIVEEYSEEHVALHNLFAPLTPLAGGRHAPSFHLSKWDGPANLNSRDENEAADWVN